MNRIQTACYGLIASAFVLAGLLVYSSTVTSDARAEMVIARDNFTIMTAPSRSGEEALYVLDNVSGQLLVYRLNVPRKQLEFAASADVNAAFSGGGGGGR